MKPTRQPKFLAVLLLGLLFSWSIQAQEKLRYTGPFQVASFVGEVDYTYQIIDGDTLLQGPFSMKRSNLDALLDQKDKTFSFTGAFENGFPNGPWNFQFGEFESDQKTEVVGFQYRVNVDGIQHQAQGDIQMGRPDGLWTISEQHIEDSEVKETLFQSQITYNNGVPQQSFRIEGKQSTLVGRFLRDGLAHDSWTLFGDESTETWSFNEGVLTQIRLNDTTIAVFQGPFKAARTINLDKRFSKILKLQLKKEQADGLRDGINKLLAENAAHYRKLDDILSQLGKSQFLPLFKAKVPYYPLDSLERNGLEAIQKEYGHSSKVAEGLLENTQLNLLRRSDNEAQFLYSAVEKFKVSFLDPLDKVVHFSELGILDYLDRDLLAQRLFPTGKPSTTIVIDESERTFAGPNANNFNFEGEVMEALSQMSSYAKVSLDQIAAILYEKVKNEQQQQEFVVLEEQMIAQINSLNQMVDSLDTSGTYGTAILHIKSIAENKLNAYSSSAATEGKLEEAKQLVPCLETLKSLSQNLAALPERELEIQESYKDAVWNPFMANLMEEEVKKRITSAYRNVLIPFIVDEASGELDYGKAGSLNRLLTELHERMLELREEDTHKLERKLRKEKNPNTILELFNLQPLEN
ncbi:hypothetical protein [Flagellimonas algicola]|uniref:WG repeat protein n=1 Tax=Flagellimonas algicola TaxID=2583815 RepID=A0ABY2WPG8_9FLAO|nr:hypothetical protein [Allomuricauda algicola]TMU56562.1 hypothetical protein FGG15_03210 [Allomuricauda algicola]